MKNLTNLFNLVTAILWGKSISSKSCEIKVNNKFFELKSFEDPDLMDNTPSWLYDTDVIFKLKADDGCEYRLRAINDDSFLLEEEGPLGKEYKGLTQDILVCLNGDWPEVIA